MSRKTAAGGTVCLSEVRGGAPENFTILRPPDAPVDAFYHLNTLLYVKNYLSLELFGGVMGQKSSLGDGNGKHSGLKCSSPRPPFTYFSLVSATARHKYEYFV